MYIFLKLNKIIIVIHILIILFFSSFLCCTSFPPLPFINNFYCDILHLHNIVIPIINLVITVNLKKTGMASRNILMNHTRCSDQLCSSLWTSRFWFFVVVVCDLI